MIRQMTEEDIPSVLKFINQTFISDPRYNPQQIAQLKVHATPSKMKYSVEHYYMIVDVDVAGRINGMGGAYLNKIVYLYVDPVMQGQGVGHAILENLEDYILKTHKFFDKKKTIDVSSTENAVDFYKKHNYIEQEIEMYKSNGVVIPRVKLRKLL